MKKILLFFTILTATLCSQPAQAKPRIPVTYGDHEKIEKVAELPDEFTTDNGVKLALGHKYTVFELAFVPIWTTNKGKLVGFDPNDDQNYYDIDAYINTGEGRAAILEAAGVKDISELHKIPFWDAWGGKLVVLALLALILYGIFGREKKPQDANE